MEDELLPQYDTLSFSGFSILPEDNRGSNSVAMQSTRNSFSSVDNYNYNYNYHNNNELEEKEEEEDFEFSTTNYDSPIGRRGYSSPDLVFCGGNIDIREADHRLNHEYGDYLMNNNNTVVNIVAGEKAETVLAGKDVIGRSRSDSAMKRNSSYGYSNKSGNYGINQNQKVNITSLTSMSSKSRRRMFMFGPVKFSPEMELTALKERQSRGRVPTTMFPAALPLPSPAEVIIDGDKALLISAGGGGDGGNNKSRRGKIRGNWRLLLRLLKGRSPITSMLAKSLGCAMVMTTPAPANVVGSQNNLIY